MHVERGPLRRLLARASLLVRAALATAMQSLLVLVLTVVAFCAGVLFVAVLVLVPLDAVAPGAVAGHRAILLFVAGGVLGVVVWWLGLRHEIRAARSRVLRETRAATPTDDPALVGAATRLATAQGRPLPGVRIRETDAPLCFTLATADGPVVVLSAGLLERLGEDEVEAVLAHEFAHLANADHRLLAWVVAPLLAAEEFHATFEDDSDPRILVWRALAAALVVWGRLAVGALSRGRELAADRAAVATTGAPGALASALETLASAGPGAPDEDLRAHAHALDALSVLPTLDPTTDARGGLLATHPSTEERIERLRRLAGEA